MELEQECKWNWRANGIPILCKQERESKKKLKDNILNGS
jgi:hypothetical protein